MANPADRGQKRDYHGNFRSQDHSTMDLTGAPNSILSSSSAEGQSMQNRLTSYNPLPSGAENMRDSRNVISYGAQYLPPKPQTALQYNAAGYAFSSTYDSSKQSLAISKDVVAKPALPAPPIQGTKISLDTPEDIAAWIAERKKKWPTDANVEKNKAEKAKRGAGPSNKRQKKQKKGRHSQGQPDRQETPRGPDDRAPTTEDSAAKTANIAPITNVVTSLDIALAALDETIDSEISPPNQSDDIVSTDVPAPATDLPVIVTEETEKIDRPEEEAPSSDSDTDSESDSSDISSSSSSDESDAPPELASSRPAIAAADQTATRPDNRPRRPCKYFRSGKCTRGDACTFSHDASTPARIKENNRPAGGQNTRVDDRYKWRKRKSLYDRLVEAELAKEENKQGAVQ